MPNQLGHQYNRWLLSFLFPSYSLKRDLMPKWIFWWRLKYKVKKDITQQILTDLSSGWSEAKQNSCKLHLAQGTPVLPPAWGLWLQMGALHPRLSCRLVFAHSSLEAFLIWANKLRPCIQQLWMCFSSQYLQPQKFVLFSLESISSPNL